MRTLKKVLALSLVCAMAFTMMAGATFKDQDKINSDLTSDIELMQALNVLKGDENGNLNPTDTVTREQAAKMIYVLKNGGTDDGATGWKGMNLFSDVQSGRWSEGYINYCASIGIINGWMENGKSMFAPTSPVTGVELGKMLLTLVGYKASEQGYTGTSWQANVLADGQEAGIFASFTPSVLAPTPREWTARLMVNALNAYSITYSKGELVVSDKTYAEKNLKLYAVEGVLTETNSNKMATSGQLSATLKDKDDNNIKVGSDTISYDDAKAATPLNSMLGQKVKVFYKLGTTDGVANASKIYSVIASKDSVAKTVALSDITMSTKKDGSNNITNVYMAFNGYSKTDYTGKTIKVYNNNLAGADAVGTSGNTGNTLLDTFDKNSTIAVKLIDNNNDGVFETAMFAPQTTYAVVKANDSASYAFTLLQADGTTSISLPDAAGTNLTFNKSNNENYAKYLNFVDTVAKDDVVAITPNTTSGKLVYDVKLATKVAEAATGYTLNSAGTAYSKIKVGTTNYSLSANPVAGYVWTLAGNEKAGSDKTFYTDGKFVVFSKGSEEVVNVNNLVYVIGAAATQDTYDQTSYTYKVKVLHTDGTVAEYVQKTGTGLVGGTAGTNAAEAGTVYSYTVADGKISLKVLPSTSGTTNYVNAGANAGSYNNKTGVVTYGVSGAYKTSADTVFFVKDTTTSTTKYKVLKASELANSQAITAKQYAYKTISGFDTLLYGVIDGAVSSATSNVPYAFVTGSASYIGKVGDKYVATLPVWVNGKADTISFKYDDEVSARSKLAELGTTYKYKAIEYNVADGYVVVDSTLTVVAATAADGTTAFANKAWYTGELKAYSATDAVFAGQFVKVASDVKVTVLDRTTSGTSVSFKVVEDGTVVKSETGVSSVVVKVSKDSNNVVTITDIICEADGTVLTDITK